MFCLSLPTTNALHITDALVHALEVFLAAVFFVLCHLTSLLFSPERKKVLGVEELVHICTQTNNNGKLSTYNQNVMSIYFDKLGLKQFQNL